MNVPEYFSLFSGEGEFSVEVRLQGGERVQSRKASARDMGNLMDPATGGVHTALTFDEHLFEILCYEIDLLNKKLVIKGRRHGHI